MEKITSIQEFIQFKYAPDGSITDEFKAWQQSSEDRFEDISVQVVDDAGSIRDASIMDVEHLIEVNSSGEVHHVRAILNIDGRVLLATTTCVAPPECIIDWSKVVCAYSIKYE